MHLLFDFDSTIADTLLAMFEYQQDKLQDYSQKYDGSLVTWNMTNLFPNMPRESIEQMFCDEKFFDYLTTFPLATTMLEVFKEQGHTIEIVSCHKAEGMKYKEQWIKKYLPMVDKITLIPIIDGDAPFDKSSVEGDVIVDDRIDALTSSRAKNKILFGNYTWNKEGWDGLRATNWGFVYNMIQEISHRQEDI